MNRNLSKINQILLEVSEQDPGVTDAEFVDKYTLKERIMKLSEKLFITLSTGIPKIFRELIASKKKSIMVLFGMYLSAYILTYKKGDVHDVENFTREIIIPVFTDMMKLVGISSDGKGGKIIDVISKATSVTNLEFLGVPEEFARKIIREKIAESVLVEGLKGIFNTIAKTIQIHFSNTATYDDLGISFTSNVTTTTTTGEVMAAQWVYDEFKKETTAILKKTGQKRKKIIDSKWFFDKASSNSDTSNVSQTVTDIVKKGKDFVSKPSSMLSYEPVYKLTYGE
jgi:hypothetical protein